MDVTYSLLPAMKMKVLEFIWQVMYKELYISINQ